MLQLNALFLAAVHPVLPRYTLPLLPLVIVFLVGMALILWRLLKARFSLIP